MHEHTLDTVLQGHRAGVAASARAFERYLDYSRVFGKALVFDIAWG
jgi:hypothetical protein